jgi:hypothetical protein
MLYSQAQTILGIRPKPCDVSSQWQNRTDFVNPPSLLTGFLSEPNANNDSSDDDDRSDDQ